MAAFNTATEPLKTDDYFQLSCTVISGDYPYTFKWFFRGRPIYYNKHAKVTQINRRSSNLVIEAVIDKDAGEYECRVSNRGGISRVKTELIVKGTLANIFLNLTIN